MQINVRAFRECWLAVSSVDDNRLVYCSTLPDQIRNEVEKLEADGVQVLKLIAYIKIWVEGLQPGYTPEHELEGVSVNRSEIDALTSGKLEELWVQAENDVAPFMKSKYNLPSD